MLLELDPPTRVLVSESMPREGRINGTSLGPGRYGIVMSQKKYSCTGQRGTDALGEVTQLPLQFAREGRLVMTACQCRYSRGGVIGTLEGVE